MKLVHYILALYTVLLSCIPCQDVVIAASDNANTVNIISGAEDTNNHSSVDLCSPFCICACCSAITLQHTIATLLETPFFSFPDEKTFDYSHRTGSGDLTSIWQPPRI